MITPYFTFDSMSSYITDSYINKINNSDDPVDSYLKEVLSTFLCKIFMSQFFEERQVLTHFSYGV